MTYIISHKTKLISAGVIAGFFLIAYWCMPVKNPELITLFPIENYDQIISHWIKSSDRDFDQSLLTPAQQKIRKDELYAKYFGERSPWSPEYINAIFSKSTAEGLQATEQEKLTLLDNKNKTENDIQYGSNFIPHSEQWIQQINDNMNLQQFTGRKYEANQRAIAIDNIQGRVLPTNDVAFYSHKIAGQGYPFDNLQAAMIWTGTPVYILGETRDHSWSLVHTPNFIAWVKSNGIAKADENFINTWRRNAQKNLAAITSTKISIVDLENKAYRFTGFIGMLFPATPNAEGLRIDIPVMNANHKSQIYHAQLTSQQGVIIPLLPTPHHFANMMEQLINRPYGWGGMYHFNDCASELKNLFIPFGIFLPMHSTHQVDPDSYIVKQVDLSKMNVDQRLAYLTQHGHKFMTIVYIGGHVFLYIGTYENPSNLTTKMILTYQEMWGLKPANANYDSRVIIGKSVLFPLLKSYPENPELSSQANKTYFQLGYLDINPNEVAPVTSIKLKKIIE